MMPRAFESFRNLKVGQNLIWTESDSRWPYTCSQCRRDFPQGGKRWLGSPMAQMSYYGGPVLCDDCKHGRTNQKAVPVLDDQRTELF